MRKTPLSAPGGSYRRKNNYDWNSRDNRQSYDGGSGYGQTEGGNIKHGCFVPASNQSSPKNCGDDFIPLGYSSPVNHSPHNNSGNYRGHGNGHRYRNTPPGAAGGRIFNNSYRKQFYHDNQNPNFNESNSPTFYQKQHFGMRRPHRQDAHRNVDISNYLNVKSFLEDPWADLMKKYEKPTARTEDKSETGSCMASGSSCGSIPIEDLNVKSESTNLNLGSPESRTNVDEKLETIKTTTAS